jgi:iron complex outermembrane receptor protein
MNPAPRTRVRSIRLLIRAASLLAPVAPALARAEPTCAAHVERQESRRWPSPLDRLVTLHSRDLALRDALDRLATAARFRLSYSTELLALDRRVCVSYDSVAVGTVLTDLLDGAAVAPVVAGDDQVVLTPAPAARRTADHVDRQINVLDRVLVTDNALGVGQRGEATSATSVDRAQIAQQRGGALSQTLNGAVPGLWLWDQAPTSLLAQYGSLRGASSFQVSYPKIYIDGIEVANPLLLTELNPDAVERIDVIRGPQGAALYGADAIAGVVNIIMRHDGSDGGGLAQLRSSAGLSHSAYASRPVVVQEHTFGLRRGDEFASSSLSLSLGSVGSYIPGGQSWNARGDGGFRLVRRRTTLTGTARFYAKDAGVSTSPFAGSSMTGVSAPMDRDSWQSDGVRQADRAPAPARTAAESQSVREYTLGTTATMYASDRWTHAFTAGVDGYRLSGDESAGFPTVTSAADSALRAAQGGADRLTLRASSEGRFGAPTTAAATVSLAAEHSALAQHASAPGNESLGSRFGQFAGWQSNTGIVGQLDASWRGTLFATSGLRVERNDGLAATNGLVSLPMLGGAAVHDFGPLTTKLRAAYGKSIRPAGSVVRASALARQAIVQGALAPEEQSGIELGLDASVGRALTVRVTRFDQNAYDLIQPVAITSSLLPTPTTNGRLLYALQNVGEISNRGWELESSVAAGQLSATGTLALVDSRVRKLAASYSGELQQGDRMLGVPARTLSLTTAWTAPRWSASFTVARASDWINYDGIGLAIASARQPVVRSALRDYWRDYRGVTRLDASASRLLFSGISAILTARNLLDVQRGEPDNLTVLPGRTLSAGIQAKF